MQPIDQKEIERYINRNADLGSLQARGSQAAMEALTDTKDGVAGMLGLPPMVMQAAGFAFSALSLFAAVGARGTVEDWTKKGLEGINRLAKRELLSEQNVNTIGQKTKTGFMFVAPAIPEILGAFRVGRKHFRQMRELEVPIKDLLAANKNAGSGATSIASGENRIFANARSQVNKDTNNEIKGLLSAAADLLPKWFVSFTQHKIDALEDQKKSWKKSHSSTAEYGRQLGKILREIKTDENLSLLSDAEQRSFAKDIFEKQSMERAGINGTDIEGRIEELKKMQQGGGLLAMTANAAGQGGKGFLTQQYEKVDKHTSLAMCLDFEKYVEGQLRNAAGGGERVKKMLQRDVENKVAAVFAKVRKEYNMPEMTDLMKEQLETAVKMISEKIASGELHAKALINLAGETSIMQKNAVASEAQVAAELEKQIAKASPQALESAKSFTGRVGVSLKELVKSYQNMDAQEKLLFGMLVPNSVMQAAGMKATEINQVREQVEPEAQNYLACAVLNIAAADTDLLRQAGIPDRNIAAFREMAKGIAEHNDLSAVHFGPGAQQMILDAGLRLGDWKGIFDSGILAQLAEQQAEAEKEKFVDKVEKKTAHSRGNHTDSVKRGNVRPVL